MSFHKSEKGSPNPASDKEQTQTQNNITNSNLNESKFSETKLEGKILIADEKVFDEANGVNSEKQLANGHF